MIAGIEGRRDASNAGLRDDGGLDRGRVGARSDYDRGAVDDQVAANLGQGDERF
jgi:hypothetical protein